MRLPWADFLLKLLREKEGVERKLGVYEHETPGEIRCFAYGGKKSCCCLPSESCAMGLALPRGLNLALNPSLLAQHHQDQSQENTHGASSVPDSLLSPLSL